jgi:signal transduction histidine kinase
MLEKKIYNTEIIDQTEKMAKTGSWELHLVSNELYWSKGVYRILEMEPSDEKLDISKVFDVVHPDDREIVIEKITQAINQGIDYRVKNRFITPNYKIKHIISSGKVIKDENNNPIKLIGIFQDISEFEEKNEKFELLNKITKDVIYDWDIQYDIFNWGESFSRVFGYQFTDKPFRLNDYIKLIHPKDNDRLIKEWGIISKDITTNKWIKKYRFKKSDNSYTYVDETAIIFRNNEGKAIRIVSVIQDITYRKQNEVSLNNFNKRLEEQTKALLILNQELEQFAYIASHDMQEPLRMVTNFLTLLQKKYYNVLDEKGKQYITFAVDGANKMRNIILDILEYSRIGKTQEKNEKINLNIVLNEVCKMNSQKINETNAIIKYDKLPTIISSKTLLMQIFHNLIGNALKYQKTNQNPEIKIDVIEEDKKWHFKIIDNGIGIDKEFYNKIFIIFQRLHTKQEFSGSGMGLTIVKKIIENLNGSIWVESEINKGTIFHFTIPKNFDKKITIKKS